MDTVLVIWALTALAILLCRIHDIAAITASLRWLKQGEEHTTGSNNHDPFIIVLLPVLCEQSLFREILTVFAKLKDPHSMGVSKFNLEAFRSSELYYD